MLTCAATTEGRLIYRARISRSPTCYVHWLLTETNLINFRDFRIAPSIYTVVVILMNRVQKFFIS